MSADAIAVEGLDVRRGGAHILHGLDLRAPRGQITGLLGPSGSGKTTLMRVLVGVQRAAAGRAEVLGLPAGHDDLRRTVGYVTQMPAVYPDLTVAENVAYFARVVGAEAGAGERALATVGLTGTEGRIVATLSGGQRSRVSLASALVGTPDLLVLDEPTVGLDPVLRRDLWAFFRRLADEGRTLLVSSHVMDEAERCDRLWLLREGRVLADEEPGTLLARTGASDVEGAFLELIDEGA